MFTVQVKQDVRLEDVRRALSDVLELTQRLGITSSSALEVRRNNLSATTTKVTRSGGRTVLPTEQWRFYRPRAREHAHQSAPGARIAGSRFLADIPTQQPRQLQDELAQLKRAAQLAVRALPYRMTHDSSLDAQRFSQAINRLSRLSDDAPKSLDWDHASDTFGCPDLTIDEPRDGEVFVPDPTPCETDGFGHCASDYQAPESRTPDAKDCNRRRGPSLSALTRAAMEALSNDDDDSEASY